MPDITATEAARHFADLLDSVEHRGEHYTIVRRGKAVAHLEPASAGRGADVKALLPPAPTRYDLVEGIERLARTLGSRRPVMSLLLLDTRFLVDAERGGVDLDDAIQDDDDVATAAITLAELLVGAELATGKRGDARHGYVEEVLEFIPVIAYDYEVAVQHAQLLVVVRNQGRPRGAHDLLIAATARTTNRTIVTADNNAFTDLPGVSTIGHR